MFLITYYIATFFIFSELIAYCIFTCEIQHARSSDLLQILLCVCMLKAWQTLTVHAVLCVGQSCWLVLQKFALWQVSRLECAAFCRLWRMLASRTPDEYRVCAGVNYWAYSTVIKIALNTFFLAWQYKVELFLFWIVELKLPQKEELSAPCVALIQVEAHQWQSWHDYRHHRSIVIKVCSLYWLHVVLFLRDPLHFPVTASHLSGCFAATLTPWSLRDFSIAHSSRVCLPCRVQGRLHALWQGWRRKDQLHPVCGCHEGPGTEPHRCWNRQGPGEPQSRGWEELFTPSDTPTALHCMLSVNFQRLLIFCITFGFLCFRSHEHQDTRLWAVPAHVPRNRQE